MKTLGRILIAVGQVLAGESPKTASLKVKEVGPSRFRGLDSDWRKWPMSGQVALLKYLRSTQTTKET